MAFRCVYQTSCCSHVLGGFQNNSNVNYIRITPNFKKTAFQNNNFCTYDVQDITNSTEQLNLSNSNDEATEKKFKEFNEEAEHQKGTVFLTSKKYYLQGSQRSEKPYCVSNEEKKCCKEPFFLQPSKLQPYTSGNLNLSKTVTNHPLLLSIDNNKKFSTYYLANSQSKYVEAANNDNLTSNCVNGENKFICLESYNTKLNEESQKKIGVDNTTSTRPPRKLLSLIKTVHIINSRKLSSKANQNCDCPPTASRNLTSIDSCYIGQKPPCNVPPLQPLKKRCQPVEPTRKCPKVEERTPRTDDCYEVHPKKLPLLYCKKCPVKADQLDEGKPFPPLKKRPMQDQPRKCVKAPKYKCPTRADQCLQIKPKQLPKIRFSDCPKVETCMRDVEPLKSLKKLNECEPPKMPPEPEKCDYNKRADSQMCFPKQTLKKTKFDFVPKTSSPVPPNISLNRLPGLEGKDPPRYDCKEVKEECKRSDDLVPKKPPCALPTLILKPDNNCSTTCQYKRCFTSVKRKYSILSAIKSPWALSALTANIIAFNYYHNKSTSIDKISFEDDVRRNLSKIPTRPIKKQSALQCQTSLDKNILEDLTTTPKCAIKKLKYENPSNVGDNKSRKDCPRKNVVENISKGESSITKNDDLSLLVTVPCEKLHNYARKIFLKTVCLSQKFEDHQSFNCSKKSCYSCQNNLSSSLLNRKSNVSFPIYSVNNHKDIHTSAKRYDKNDKKRKCKNKKCVKIKCPGLPSKLGQTCSKEYVHKLCKKRLCPYPSFSECSSTGDDPMSEQPKLLQPKYKIIPDLQLIDATPPEWFVIDTEYEKNCVMEKLKIQRGETKTCDNFHCPYRPITNELLTEDEKECPQTKAKPSISCAPDTPVKSKTLEFKGSVSDESVSTWSSEPCEAKPSTPKANKPCTPCSSPNNKGYDDPWAPPKKSCGSASKPSQIIRFASSYSGHFSDVNKSKSIIILDSDILPVRRVEYHETGTFREVYNPIVKDTTSINLRHWQKNHVNLFQSSSAPVESQSVRYVNTITNVRNKNLWYSLCAKSSVSQTSRIPNKCQLSTSSNLCTNEDNSNSWKQSKKTKPDILDNVPAPMSSSGDEINEQPPNNTEGTCGKKNDWPECKTPIMKVCCEERHRSTCKDEYVHPKCVAQKAPFPSFSECHPPFPKFQLTECEIQKRNVLVSKHKLKIYSTVKHKHKYCIRCGTKCNKQYSTLAVALHSFGFNNCKRYICTSRNCNKGSSYSKNITLCRQKSSVPQTIMDGIKEEIKSVEANDEELNSNSYYKILKVLETSAEQGVYQFFDSNTLDLHQKQPPEFESVSKEFNESDVNQLYINFYNKLNYSI